MTGIIPVRVRLPELAARFAAENADGGKSQSPLLELAYKRVK